MTKVIDTPTNTEIVYGYVNKFDWGSVPAISRETHLGHPKQGRIYRIVKNKETGTYRLIYTHEDKLYWLYLEFLKGVYQPTEIDLDIQLITLENILDFNFEKDDLNDLVGWLETDNHKLMESLWGKKVDAPTSLPVPQPSITFVSNPEDMIKNVLKGIDEELVDFIQCLRHLKEIDPLMFHTIHCYVDYFNEHFADESIDVSNLAHDPIHGAGANISAAMKKLNTYIGPDRRKNLSEEDLMGAVKDLLTEQQRRIIHEIQ